ncbi:MAG: hypothetical protein KDA24_00785 [Deltaproteobacteria bacterium]|nr:hypothetical protein [Deltaproteobacteria bacterium]
MKHVLALLALVAVLLPGCEPEGDTFNDTADEAVTVRGWVDRADVVPGRPFTYTVEVEQADDVQFELPDPGAGIKGLVLLEVDSEPAQSAGGRTLYRQTFELKAPLPGTFLIPGVEGPWRRGDEVGTAGSGPILIEAKRTGGTEEAGDDTLRGLKAVAPPDPNRGPLYAGGLALTALLLFMGWLARRRHGEAIVPPPPLPSEVARKALKALERSGKADEPDQGPFAFEVSAILRRYLEGRFGFPAWRMTTPEVLRALPQELARELNLEAAVRTVLEASDRVKFAREPVPRSEFTQWLASVRLVIDRTPPPPEVDA